MRRGGAKWEARICVEGEITKDRERNGGLGHRSYWKFAAALLVSGVPGALTDLPFQHQQCGSYLLPHMACFKYKGLGRKRLLFI